LSEKIKNGRIPMARVWWMLALRSLVSFGFLLLLALIFSVSGQPAAIQKSAAWWLWFVTGANIASILMMWHFGKKEGVPLKDMYFASRTEWKKDLKWFLLALAGSAVLVQYPGTFLAQLLFEDAATPNAMLMQALPLLAIYPLFLLMPATQAFAELPLYWGYASPRLKAAGMRPWTAVVIASFLLSVQHMFFAFQPDWRYAFWLAVKFLPFAMWTGFIIEKRPSVLPYLMATHFLLDSSLPLLILMVSLVIEIGF